MMAWQVFEMAPRWQQLAFRHHGCFSVDREGTDLAAYRQTIDVLSHTSFPLVIFPEGEVYHLNDYVTPFHEGPLLIASSAVKRSGRPVACVPCALKYHYIDDPTPELLAVVRRIERNLDVADSGPLTAERIERLTLHTVRCENNSISAARARVRWCRGSRSSATRSSAGSSGAATFDTSRPFNTPEKESRNVPGRCGVT